MIFWQQLLSKLQEGKNVYLLTVIENSGSSPGRKGFKMLVAEDGFIFGSIGGGVMEFNLVEETKNLLRVGKKEIFLKKQIHKGNITDGSGMICSGEQTVVFHPLDSNNIPMVETILQTLSINKKKTLNLNDSSLNLTDTIISKKYISRVISEVEWDFKEQIGFKETLYIVGGGHVSVAVSNLFNRLGFQVIVLDNRENLNTLQANVFAHQKMTISYDSIVNYIPSGNDVYVAIMTNKYTEDKLVLSNLLANNYKFIGVLGSKEKLKTMWEVMLKEGFSKVQLDKVYAPIGVSIKSQTPEEIAVSIAAQIIKIKNS